MLLPGGRIMTAAEWIAKRRELLVKFLKPYRGKRHDNVGLSILAQSDLPRALDALEAVLAKAQACVDEYGDPVYNGNGFAEGIAAASREIINSVETALRSES